MQEFAVIFDFNGTMLFDTQIQYHAWDTLAKETLGHGIDQEEFLRCTNGRTSHETVEYFWGNQVNAEQKKALIEQKRRNYKEYCLTHPEEFQLAAGIPKILDYLKENHIPFTIATSSNPQSVDFYFAHLQLENWFRREAVICSDKKFPGKPAPDIYCYAANALGIPPEKCIVIEDAVAGTQSARAADIGYIILINPENDSLVRAGAQADLVIQDFDQLYEFLLKNGEDDSIKQ
ncbi:MAG: HAD family phosphatase [Eubacteriales bacterium]|nr:HAD family phosphatase [Eubacteriales bacterium]